MFSSSLRISFYTRKKKKKKNYLDEIRSEEQKLLAKVGFIQSFVGAVIPVVPTSAVVITFLVHTLLRYPLSTPQVTTICFGMIANSLHSVLAFSTEIS